MLNDHKESALFETFIYNEENLLGFLQVLTVRIQNILYMDTIHALLNKVNFLTKILRNYITFVEEHNCLHSLLQE